MSQVSQVSIPMGVLLKQQAKPLLPFPSATSAFCVVLGLEVCSTANPSVLGKTWGSAPVADGAGHGLGTTRLFSWIKAGALGHTQAELQDGS